MSTVIRSSISEKNKYYISKHRYLELKHYCLQYPEFKRTYNELCEKVPSGVIHISNDDVTPVNNILEIRQLYLDRMQLIEDCCVLADPVIGKYVLKAVTEGYSYTYFKMKDQIPCCKDLYYKIYRKFFFILNHKKK